jgi:hypothetical protein
MTNNEHELINIIRNHNNPEQAIEIAIKVMLEFLAQDELSQEPLPVFQRESA